MANWDTRILKQVHFAFLEAEVLLKRELKHFVFQCPFWWYNFTSQLLHYVCRFHFHFFVRSRWFTRPLRQRSLSFNFHLVCPQAASQRVWRFELRPSWQSEIISVSRQSSASQPPRPSLFFFFLVMATLNNNETRKHRWKNLAQFAASAAAAAGGLAGIRATDSHLLVPFVAPRTSAKKKWCRQKGETSAVQKSTPVVFYGVTHSDDQARQKKKKTE